MTAKSPSNQAAVTTALAEKAETPVKAGPTFGQLVQSQIPAIEKYVGNKLTAERLARLALTEFRTVPKLSSCSLPSVMAAVMKAAALKLEPGPLGLCYFVPYGQECTFILGYKGMVRLALNSGAIRSFDAQTVYANDTFEYELGLDPKLKHVPADGDRGDAVRWYVIARYTDGGAAFSVRDKVWVESRRARSRAKNNGPWVTDYDAMALKSILRDMAKWLPLEVEAAEAIVADAKAEAIDVTAIGEDPAIEEPPGEQGALEASSESVETEVVGSAPPEQPARGPSPAPDEWKAPLPGWSNVTAMRKDHATLATDIDKIGNPGDRGYILKLRDDAGWPMDAATFGTIRRSVDDLLSPS